MASGFLCGEIWGLGWPAYVLATWLIVYVNQEHVRTTSGHTCFTHLSSMTWALSLLDLSLFICRRIHLKYATYENPSISNTLGLFFQFSLNVISFLIFCHRLLVTPNFLLQRKSSSNPIISSPFLISLQFELSTLLCCFINVITTSTPYHALQ